jgi:hypothetical protein
VLVLAPGAVALAGGPVALRVVPALLRALARAAGRPMPSISRRGTRAGGIGGYLTSIALARAPERTAAAVAVVAVAAAAATFGLGHARALQRGERDQAAYRTAGAVRTLAAVPGRPDARGTLVIRTEADTLGRLLGAQELRPGPHRLAGAVGPRERGSRAVAFEIDVPPGAGAATNVAAVRPGSLYARLAAGRRVSLGSLDDWEPTGQGDLAGGSFSYSVAGSRARKDCG